MKSITFRGHHLRILYQHYIKGAPLELIKKSIEERYNEEHAINLIDILLRIVNNDGQIVFTDGLDDLCSAERCPLYEPSCEDGRSSRGDRYYIQRYGFEIGKQYPTKEVLTRLKEVDGSFMLRMF